MSFSWTIFRIFGLVCVSKQSLWNLCAWKNSCHRCLPRWNLSWALAKFSKALGPLDPLTAIANSHTMHHRAENSFEISSNYFGWGQFYLIWLTECTYCDACWLIFHSSAFLGYCRLFLLCVAQCEEILKNVQLLYYLLYISRWRL